MPEAPDPINVEPSEWTSRQHPLERELGIPVPPWEDERLAPPVDTQKLRELWQKELAKGERLELWGNVLRYQSWARALCQIMVEEFRRKKSDDQA